MALSFRVCISYKNAAIMLKKPNLKQIKMSLDY